MAAGKETDRSRISAFFQGLTELIRPAGSRAAFLHVAVACVCFATLMLFDASLANGLKRDLFEAGLFVAGMVAIVSVMQIAWSIHKEEQLLQRRTLLGRPSASDELAGGAQTERSKEAH